MFVWLVDLGKGLLNGLFVGLLVLIILIESAYGVDESLVFGLWIERKYLQVIHKQTAESATTVGERMLRLGEITAVSDETGAPDTCTVASTLTLNPADVAEITIDLESLYAELGKLSPDAPMASSERQAFIARVARIRSECFCHPISEALTQRLETGVRQIVKQVIEEALVQELNEWLGFEPYERTGEAKRPEQHRSGSYTRSLRTSWGWIDELHVPKLRCGNEKRVWRVLKRYERSFGPWLDLQLYLYTVGASQSNLQEILALSFGQVLSVKAIEHLTDVAQKEMEAFRSAPITDTPLSSWWMA
jgi:hypothetical protein